MSSDTPADAPAPDTDADFVNRMNRVAWDWMPGDCQRRLLSLAHRGAAAADELALLTAEVERLKEQCETPFMDGHETAKEEYRPRLIAAEAEVEALTAALEWYADKVEKCRNLLAVGDAARSALDADGGARARAALKEPRT